MGTWSHGNFENDAALDWLSETTGQLLSEITEAMDSPDTLDADEWEADIVPCRIELLCVMSENGMRPNWPELDLLNEWKSIYLAAWDASIDELDPDPDYKSNRRTELVATFDRMLRCAQS